MLLINGILSLIIVWASLAINNHSAIILCMVSVSSLLIIRLNAEPLVLGRYSSFRGFVLVPFLALAYQGLVQLFALAIVYVFETLFKKFDIKSDAIKEFQLDVEACQSIILIISFLYSLATWFPRALIALAYRYDMAQAD